MGNEGACAAVHQRIAYKSGSVHMEPVPVVPWAPADILRKLHALKSLLAARQHQMALTKTMTMLKSLLPVLHPHRTFQFHHHHCCLRPPVVRSVGCLLCGWYCADLCSHHLLHVSAFSQVQTIPRFLSPWSGGYHGRSSYMVVYFCSPFRVSCVAL